MILVPAGVLTAVATGFGWFLVSDSVFSRAHAERNEVVVPMPQIMLKHTHHSMAALPLGSQMSVYFNPVH
jgi:plastocyanin domain-containing protein